MLFSSVPFLFYFLPCVLAVYFVVPCRGKNFVLLLASLFFYGWGEPRYLPLLLLSAAQSYGFGLLIEAHRRRGWLAVSVAVSLLLLGWFKYADFTLQSFHALTGLSVPTLRIALPIGISFYTFQALSYVVDVYRGEVPAQRNFIDFAAYLTMFPQLIAGPIVRYRDIAAQLRDRTHSLAGAAEGVRRFLLGLSKKVLLANTLGALAAAFRQSAAPSVLFAWIYAVAFSLQLYFDFSAYSDMAIGLGRIFGFSFPENFNYPYLSASVTEFWRRWHISLGSWFRDYLYIPLGGNRVGKLRWVWNLLIVWFATGLWHGAAWNFALWGLLFALLLAVEKLLLLPVLQRRRFLGHVYTLFFVLLSFVLFDATSLPEAAAHLRALFGGLPAVTTETLYYLRSYAVVLALGIVGATPLPARLVRAAERKLGAVYSVLEPVGLLALLVVCTAFLVDGSYNPFLYFRF